MICTKISKNTGKKCARQALKGKNVCFGHDPESKERRVESIKQGFIKKREALVHIPKTRGKARVVFVPDDDDIEDQAISQYLIAQQQLVSIVLMKRLRRSSKL